MDEFTSKRLMKDMDFVKKTLHSMDKTLALNTQSLIEHAKRTDILEKKLEPVEQHVEQVRGAGKLIGILALVATILTAYLLFK